MSGDAVPVELFSSRWGRGERRVLLIHGLGSNSSAWWRVADALTARGLTIVAPDLRGHGSSPRAASYLADALVADLLELGTGWAVAVGHSLGGLLVARAARAEPTYAHALVLVDPVLEVSDDGFDDVLADQIADARTRPEPEEILRRNPRWHPEDAANKARALAMTSPFVVESILRENSPWNYADIAADLAIPTVIIGADPVAGALFDPAVGKRLAEHNPAISYRMIPGAGHSIFREDPAPVVDAIISLLG